MRFLLVVLCLIFALPAVAQEAGETAPNGSIAVEADAGTDRAIRERIDDIRAELQGFETIGVSVASGVVTLQGEVVDTAEVARLADLITRIDGVVAVENNVVETTDVSERLAPALERIEGRFQQGIALLPLIAIAALAALVVSVLGFLLARSGLWDRLAPNAFIADIYRQVLRLLFVIAGLVLALDIIGATALLGTILGAAGIVGLAIGFAVRDTVENFIASIMLSVRQPFAPNDLVEIEGDLGRVIRLTSRATILLSPDGNQIRLPNATVFKGRIVNYTRNRERRFEFDIGVEADSDLGAVRQMVEETVEALPFTLTSPPALVWIETMNETGVVLRVTGWIDQHESNFALARSEAIRKVKDAIEASGVAIPDTTYRIRLDGMGGGIVTASDRDPAPKPAAPKLKSVVDDVDVSSDGDDEALEQLVEAERQAPDADDLLSDNGAKE